MTAAERPATVGPIVALRAWATHLAAKPQAFLQQGAMADTLRRQLDLLGLDVAPLGPADAATPDAPQWTAADVRRALEDIADAAVHLLEQDDEVLQPRADQVLAVERIIGAIEQDAAPGDGPDQ